MSDIIDIGGPAPEEPRDKGLVDEAVRQFFAERTGPNDVVTWETLCIWLGIRDPKKENDAQGFQQAQLRLLNLRKKFEQQMLVTHNVAFDTAIGQGLRFVPPTEQTQWAQLEMLAELRRALSKGSARLRHINLAALDAQQKARNMDAVAQHAALRTMFRAEVRRAERLVGREAER